MEQKWTFEELYQALLQDESWEIPPEERGMYLYDLAWTLYIA